MSVSVQLQCWPIIRLSKRRKCFSVKKRLFKVHACGNSKWYVTSPLRHPMSLCYLHSTLIRSPVITACLENGRVPFGPSSAHMLWKSNLMILCFLFIAPYSPPFPLPLAAGSATSQNYFVVLLAAVALTKGSHSLHVLLHSAHHAHTDQLAPISINLIF